jgi:hypothetical protein
MRKTLLVVSMLVVSMARAQAQDRTGLRPPDSAVPPAVRAKGGMGMGMGMGSCTGQDLPYMGMYTDGASQWWEESSSEMHDMMCRSNSGTFRGMYFDMWRVPARPGDTFDISFAGPNNTLLVVADDDPAAPPYTQMYATMPGTGAQLGMFTGGWTAFTVPSSFTHGNMVIWIGNTMSQMQYMMGAVKTASQTSTACTSSATAMCLDGARFQVSVDWTKPTGEAGQGHALVLTGDTGYFWFFDDSNVELVVKVLDGCGVNGHYWVFAGGLTNVAVTLHVSDTQTGSQKPYQNPQGAAFVPVQDTGAFPCQ